MIEDTELLHRYATTRAETAFAEFVHRHIDFVYACALRRLGGDAHAADDVTQQVFVAAAHNAASLSRHPVITGWLYTATRNVTAQWVRSERRRQRREEEAHRMNDINDRDDLPAQWDKLRPVLDEALDTLDAADRTAILLRFFEGSSFAQIGARLRIAENTARMRVERATAKLSTALGRRGVSSTAGALAIVLSHPTGVAAPAGLAAAATGAAVAGGLGGATTAVGTFMAMTKLQIGVAGAVALALAGGFAVQETTRRSLARELAHASKQAEVENAAAQRAASERRAVRERAAAKLGELDALQRRLADLEQEVEARRAAATAMRNDSPARRLGKDEQVTYDLRALDSFPEPTAQTAPLYPFELRRSGLKGEATVEFVVAPDGSVTDAFGVDGTHPAMVDAAVAALKRWKFKPGMKGGVPVAARMQVPVQFQLSGAAADAAAGTRAFP